MEDIGFEKPASPRVASPDSKVVKLPPIKKIRVAAEEGKLSLSMEQDDNENEVNEMNERENLKLTDEGKLTLENEEKMLVSEEGRAIKSCEESKIASPENSLKNKTEGDRTLKTPLIENSLTGVLKLKELFLGKFPESDGKAKVSIDNSVWDYVLVLKNPDYDLEDQRNVMLDEAEQFYKNSFKPKKQLYAHQQNLGFLNEITAFTEAFNELDNFETGKKYKNGGSFEGSGCDFKKIKSRPNDFLGLCNNTILVKLVSHLTLKVKILMSSDGRHLFYIISADEEDLEMEAERTRYRKELELAVTDVMSLIPCDDALRPYHMLKCPIAEVKQVFKSVKSFLATALIITKNTEKISYKYEPVGVSLIQWQAYKQFLDLLAIGIKTIEDSVKCYKNKMILFKSLLKNSLNKANSNLSNKDKLKTMWDRVGINTPFAPFAEYMRSTKDDELQKLWKSHKIDPSGKRSIFKNIERIRLLTSYIYTQVNLSALEESEVLVAHYPFHTSWQLHGKLLRELSDIPEDDKVLKLVAVQIKEYEANLTSLVDVWRTSILNQKLPLGRIRNYFGEKIALYFEFLRNFQTSLVLPALAGLVVFILQQVLGTSHSVVLAANALFCIFISIYATVFLEYWKRIETALSVTWGQTEFEKLEIPRPQFKGELRRSLITDDMEEIYYPERSRYKFFLLSGVFSIGIILMILAIVSGLIVLKAKDYMIHNGYNYADIVCSVINAIQIQIFNIIYSRVVRILTNLENHKTQNKFEDSLIVKTFIFQFVNSFNSLIYIAFIRCNVDNLEESICVDELSTQLISIFLVSYVKNLLELGHPYLMFMYKNWRNSRNRVADRVLDPGDLRSDIESQLIHDEYVTLENDGTIDDYLELAIQFGYITLFSIAFPLSTTMLFVGLWFEMLVDKLKLLKLVRRPIPLATRDIGVWYEIFSNISGLAIISNTALFCFTLPTFQNWESAEDNRTLIFVIVVAFLYVVRGEIMSWIPDVQYKYEVIQRRHEFIVEKYLRGAPNMKVVEDVEMFDTTLYYSK